MERLNEEIRRRTGYLPGGIAFYDSMTGAEHLAYLSRLDGQPSPLRGELIERLELSKRDLGRPIPGSTARPGGISQSPAATAAGVDRSGGEHRRRWCALQSSHSQ